MPEVTYIGLPALIARAREALEEAVAQSAEDLVAAQMAAAPVDTGTLRASIHIDSIEAGGDSVTATTATGGESSAYAIFVHEGTGPHEITPKAAQALAWPGGAHPVKVVHHPGTHPDHFMSDPLLANVGVYEQAMARAAASVF
jgi:hypothetical protein